ncbi:hypothetical protein [Snodgrassella alvi]|nr:hypothetical protein [Snodgrassella alvi]
MGCTTARKSFCYFAMSCAIVGLSRCAYYYQPKLPDDSVIMSVLSR